MLDVKNFVDAVGEDAKPPTNNNMAKPLKPFEMPTKLFEKVSLKRVEFLIRHCRDMPKPHYKAITEYHRYLNKKTGVKTCRYDFGEKSGNYGRMFCFTSLQKVPSNIRAFITDGRYRDIDMKNANPTILLALCKRHNIKCDYLEDYCKNRDKYLDEYSEELNIERGEIKHGVLHMMFGERLTKLEESLCRNLEAFPFLRKIKKESEEITDELIKLDVHKNLVKTLRKTKGKNYKKTGLLSYIVQTYEHQVLFEIAKFLREKKYEIGTYIFDGALVESKEPIDCLDELENRIEEKMGFRVEVVDKPMKTTYVYQEEPEEEEDKETQEEKILREGVAQYDLNGMIFSRKRTNISYQQQKELFEKSHFKINDPTLFCTEFIDEEGKFKIIEKKSFLVTYEDVKYASIKIDKEGEQYVVYDSFIKDWVADPNKRCYDSFIFNPDPNLQPNPRFYNLFTGFEWTRDNCTENFENIRPYLEHLKKRLCNGNEEYYNYLVKWMAHLIQKPHVKTGVALVMKSKPGGGKGITVNPLMEIMGLKYFAQPSDQNDVLGNFNGILKGVLLLYLDELAWGGDKSAAGKLKKIITETIMTINQKGVPTYAIKNFMNTIISSNEEWVVPAIPGERRYFVLQLLEELCGNSTPEKRKIVEEIMNVKPEHLAHFLYSIDLTDFDVRKVPQTKALREQQMNSYSSIKKWWMDVLSEGSIKWTEREGQFINKYEREIDSQEGFSKDVIYDNFDKSNFKDKYMSKVAFWKELAKIADFSNSRPKINGERFRYVHFDSKDMLLHKFKEVVGNCDLTLD